MKKMSTLNVALLVRAVQPLHGVGGLERYADELVRYLLKSDVQIDLITQRPKRPQSTAMSDWLARDGLTTHFVPYRTFPFAGRRGTTVLDRSTAYPLFGWRAGRLAWRLVRRGGITLVHGNGASVCGYASARARNRIETVPFVFNPQGLEEFGATDPQRAGLKRFGYWPLQRAVIACARSADRVIATDRVLRQPILDHLHVKDRVVRVVPNAVDLCRVDTIRQRGHHSYREKRDVGPGSVLLSVGRLERNKGFDLLAAALARVRASRQDVNWYWVVIGEGPFGSRLRRLVCKLGLSPCVRFLGKVDDDELHAWYDTATLFVHPTLYEGSSLVTLEAMAHGRAVVATRAGGLTDKVLPGVTGWLVQPGDVAALASAVTDALRGESILPAMGQAGRQLVEREFSWGVVIDRLLAVYDELLTYG